MYKRQINELNNMRLQGYKPTYIAKTLGISVNTVKSHIRRHPQIPNTHNCEYCGKPVLQNEGRKLKRFCSDKCTAIALIDTLVSKGHLTQKDKAEMYTVINQKYGFNSCSIFAA